VLDHQVMLKRLLLVQDCHLSAGALTSTITQYTNEDAQDAVGGALTSEFTYNDAG
jgi:hypothetical protein